MPRLFVNLDVPDIDAAIAFYTSALGLSAGRRFDAEFVELLGAEVPIYLLKKAGGSAPIPGAPATRDYRRQLDGLYRIISIGGPHNDPTFERIATNGSLFEVEDGNRYGGTFRKNLTLPTGYIPNVSSFALEELEQLAT